MNREKVISREYKLVLKAEKFLGQEKDLLSKAQNFWKDCITTIDPSGTHTAGTFDKINGQWEIRFYDTSDLSLYHTNYIFRERRDLLSDEREVTLKFRHPDRYFSQDRDMLSRKIGSGELKFEEDIKAPFLQLYSFSSTQPVKNGLGFTKLKPVLKLYPGLKPQLNALGDNESLSVVNNLSVREMVITGSALILSEDPSVHAECALIVWYDANEPGKDPIIVEFSFRYRNKKEKYDRETTELAYSLFLSIQQGMKSWIDDKNPTKTGFVYA